MPWSYANIDWKETSTLGAALAQGFAAIVALGIGTYTLQRDRRREAEADYAKVAAAFDLAIELGRFFDLLRLRTGDSLSLSAHSARIVLRTGEYLELIALLDDVRPSEVGVESAEAYRDIRALVRDVKSWLTRVAEGSNEGTTMMPMGSWEQRFTTPHSILLAACNSAALRANGVHAAMASGSSSKSRSAA